MSTEFEKGWIINMLIKNKLFKLIDWSEICLYKFINEISVSNI